MPELKTLGRSIVCELATGEKFLVGTIDIDCPICGGGQYVIPGHHMRAMLKLLAEWVEAHPDLTGPLTITEVKREHFEGTAPADPTTN